jgi:hypothetical protein
MVYLNNHKKVKIDDKNYIVVSLTFKGSKVPVVFDDKYYEKVKSLNKSWKINDSGFVVSAHMINNQEIEISLHEVIMALYNKENGLSKKNNNIVHLNKLGIDNRKDNLIYDTLDKETGKNLKKKKRIIEFPEESGINADDIPSFMWYLKPNDTHDERFIIEIGDIKWKTTSSSKLSLKYKLEEGKKYLRELKEAKPEIFEENSMNGEFNLEGKKLLKSFFNISKEAGFKNLRKLTTDNLTDFYLKENLKGLSAFEKEILKSSTFYGVKRSKELYNKLPKESGLKLSDLPKYCFYVPENDKRGDYFKIEGHPSMDYIWKTAHSKKLSTKDKYNELINYYNQLDE